MRSKVLIGSTIHESKDYCAERWLENVSELIKNTPADFLIVDNSPGLGYIKKLKSYCQKFGLHPKFIHLELPSSQEKYERIARCREEIRKEILRGGYDAWFVWESDQIIPADTLTKLLNILEGGNYMMVNPDKKMRDFPDVENTDFGCCMIRRDALEKYSFILDFGSDPEMPATWEPGEAWFKRRVVRGGGSYLDVFGVITPIYHLDK